MARTPSDPNMWVPGVSAPPDMPATAASIQLAYVGAMTRGFPRAETPVQEWVPGISTPEGLVLASAGAAGAAAVAAASLPAIERALSTLTGLAAAGISTGVPVSSVWLGMTFLGP